MPSHAKRCRYCRVPLLPGVKPTMDHVVPKWVLRYYSERFKRNTRYRSANLVTACITCNNGKGPMPAAIFVKVRLHPVALERERVRWGIVAAQVRRGDRWTHQDLVYAEFGRPIPPHFATGQKRIEIRAGAEASHPGIFLEEETTQ